jgi:TetR/AcrR family transcriptional regulator, regulator of cefoperazone and chloramphenicol sensitivity
MKTALPTALPSKQSAKVARTDGEQSRERLLHSALALFAEHGYAKTSTRQLAEAAGTNLAAISYYFGDKAGLYRAAFNELHSNSNEEITRFVGPELSLSQALLGFYSGFVEPLRHGVLMEQCIKLHMREMLEPTGVWAEEINQGIKPMHDALVQVLCRHLGLRRPDDEVQRLAVCIAALGVHLHVGRDVTDAVAPQLHTKPKSLDRWAERLTMYAEAMVAAEAARRITATKEKK